ncbi:MAG TPA: hypothetical protein VFV34_17055 [Blastocatellia bacterium]|nr:hypothetical protein [Blastocatellia bacterium]
MNQLPQQRVGNEILVGLLLAMLALAVSAEAQPRKWRQANEKELRALIPARATVEAERIETEMRTASGVTDGAGKFIAGVVMITAGYSAEGKYSHFLITHVPVKIGDVELRPGEYVFGKKRIDADSLEISFYEAASGKAIGSVKAVLDQKRGPVYSLLITPGGNGSPPAIKVGRFSVEYSVAK